MMSKLGVLVTICLLLFPLTALPLDGDPSRAAEDHTPADWKGPPPQPTAETTWLTAEDRPSRLRRRPSQPAAEDYPSRHQRTTPSRLRKTTPADSRGPP
uniref:M superfamily MMSK group conopeptide Rt0C01 n=1 Tax=Conus rattus TaxID=72283 RepID=H2BKL2_CONRT|nr:M superfamily MMSK group conopeptide Rt0C01 [Conus rattus]